MQHCAMLSHCLLCVCVSLCVNHLSEKKWICIFNVPLPPPLFFFHFPPALSPVAVLLKDDYFVRGAGLPGRFKAEKMEFHWGQSNGSAGSEHSINGRRFPVEVKYPVPTVRFDKCSAGGPRGVGLDITAACLHEWCSNLITRKRSET